MSESKNQKASSSSSSGQTPTTEHPVVSASGDAKTNDAAAAELQAKLYEARRECVQSRGRYLSYTNAFAQSLASSAFVHNPAWHRPFEDMSVSFPVLSKRVLAVCETLKSLEVDLDKTHSEMVWAQRRLDDFTKNPRRASEQESTVTDTMGVDDNQKKTSESKTSNKRKREAARAAPQSKTKPAVLHKETEHDSSEAEEDTTEIGNEL